MKRAIGLLLVAVVLAVAAGALASLALFALAVGLLLVTLAAAVSVAATARRLVITRSVLHREVGEDQPIGVRLQVRGAGRLPLPVHLEAQIGTDRWVPLSEDGGLLQLLVGRRGPWRLEPSRLRLRDGLGIVDWPLVVGRPEPLLILPTPTCACPSPHDRARGRATLTWMGWSPMCRAPRSAGSTGRRWPAAPACSSAG